MIKCFKNDSITYLNDEERHYDQFDTEDEHLQKFGDRYLALQSIERSKTIAAGPPTHTPVE